MFEAASRDEQVQQAFSLEGLALARARIADPEGVRAQLQSAVRLLGAANVLREQLDYAASRSRSVSLRRVTHPEYAHQVAALRAVLGEAAWATGRRLPMEQAIVQALEDECVSLSDAAEIPEARNAEGPNSSATLEEAWETGC